MTIRLGMIGCGTMAGAYLAGLRELEPRLSITALCDIDRAKLERASKSAPGAALFADYHGMMSGCDAVVIALPHDLHHDVARDCMRAGLHVLLEKPMAITERQCLELIRVQRECRRVLSIGYVMRHDPLWSKMGEFITGSSFGEVFQVSIWTEQFTDVSRGAWIGDPKRVGGGQLLSHGCHYIDLLMLWLGRPVSGTHVGTNRGTPWMQMEGTSNVAIRFEGGVLGYHFGTWGARGTRLGYAVHAHTTEGMLELDHAQGTITLHRNQSGGDLPALQAALAAGAKVEGPTRTVVYHRPIEGKHTNAEVTEFLDCIVTGREPVANPRVSLQSLRVIWRLYDAEQSGMIADLRGLGLDEFTERPIVGTAGQPDVDGG